MKSEFNKIYQGPRSPIGFYIHAAWFQAEPQRFVEYKLFLDYLRTLPDVYIVSIRDTTFYYVNPQINNRRR
jgi:hypothetical protein